MNHQSSITLKSNEINSTLIGLRRPNTYLETINKAPSLNYDFSIHVNRPVNQTNSYGNVNRFHRTNLFQQGIINRIHGMQYGCSNCDSTN